MSFSTFCSFAFIFIFYANVSFFIHAFYSRLSMCFSPIIYVYSLFRGASVLDTHTTQVKSDV